MSRYIDEDERGKWVTIAEQLAEAYSLISQAEVSAILTLNKDGNEAKVCHRISDVRQELAGLSYLCLPQQEWTGGDSSDSGNFKYRPPHISER